MAIELTFIRNNPQFIDVFIRRKETEYKKKFGILVDDGRFYFDNNITDITIGCVSTLLSLNLVNHIYRLNAMGEAQELDLKKMKADATALPFAKYSINKYDLKPSNKF